MMEELRAWLKRQVEAKLVERNSGLGTAIAYFRRHWEKPTLFLRVAGAPLDNHSVERALNKSILHRNNALFCKTHNGATVGDIHRTLIHTYELNGVNPFEYPSVLRRNAARVEAAPDRWLPWNYREALEEPRAAPAAG